MRPLFYYVAPSFHTGAKCLVELLERRLLGILCLLLQGSLVLSSPDPTGHCAGHGTSCRSLACIPGNGPDRRSAGGSTSRSPYSLTSAYRRTR